MSRRYPGSGAVRFVLPVMLSCLLVAQTSSRQGSPSRPSVILITIDTLRADHLPSYGYRQIQTPTLDSLAHDGVVFTHAVSQVPLTWPSHAAILTGTYPFQNGVQDFTGHPLSPEFRTIAESFQEAGYATGAVVSSFVLDRSWGLARGFDYYDDAFSREEFQKKNVELVERRAGESVTEALNWLRRTRKRPIFLWVHLYDPHRPYDPPEPFRTQYQDRPYDGEIAYADHELGRLIAWLKQSGVYQTSVIAVLSDHGESLGEHGESEHGFFLYDATTRVPLIVKAPGGSRISRTPVASPVETIAVAPTLLALARVHDKIASQLQANSLFDAAAKNAEVAYNETFYPFSSFGWSPLHSLESDRYHYVDAPEPELYDLLKDPRETTNLASKEPETTAVFKDKLKQRLQTGRFPAQATGNLSPDAAEKLRALGYAAYQSPVSSAKLTNGLADPKSRIAEFNSILQAQDAFREQRFSDGRELLTKIESADPQMYVIPFMLGEAALTEQNWNEATTQLSRCLDLNPGFDEAMTGLAQALHQQGKDDESQKWLEKAVQSNPMNYRAWYALGTLNFRKEPSHALSAYERAVSIQPNFAEGQRDLGVLQVSQKQFQPAVDHLQRAVVLGMDDARVHNFLGIAYNHTDRPQLAVKSFQEAIRQDPEMAEAHLNLGLAYQKLNKPSAAKLELDAACRLQSQFCGMRPRQ